MIKKLLFEGCGLTGTAADSDIGNTRISTAFHDDEGKSVYLELCGHVVTKYTDKRLLGYGDVVGIVDCSYYINTSHPLNDLWADDIVQLKNDDRKFFPWNKEGILKLLKQLNTTVEDIEIDNSGAYRVFTEMEDVYSYGDIEQI